eukprot:TRINITY_DN396_c0_g1_i2.p1 TRINITY_DN396_c0_g1~~TRINITY_DN396_c0_g1_i2.p1  ORF type:complete len:112 (-),score=18.70 TRINITY_DN396_c0_g1_i2:137-472(-)
MGQAQRRSRTHHARKEYSKSRRTRRRTKDLDQIQDEIKKAAKKGDETKEINPELPGLGQFLCMPCDRYFISEDVMKQHFRTREHKRRVKQVEEKPWSQREAEAAAGMAAPR